MISWLYTTAENDGSATGEIIEEQEQKNIMIDLDPEKIYEAGEEINNKDISITTNISSTTDPQETEEIMIKVEELLSK